MSEVKGERKQSHPQKPQADNPLVTCPRCGGALQESARLAMSYIESDPQATTYGLQIAAEIREAFLNLQEK